MTVKRRSRKKAALREGQEVIQPIRGNQLDALRDRVGHGQRISMQDYLFELGMHRQRFRDLEALGDEAILRPRLEILLHLLERFPQISITQSDLSISDAIDLLNAVRPKRSHTPTDVAILLGAEATSGWAWARGQAMSPTTQRLLRAFMLIVGGVGPDEREEALVQFEAVVFGVATGHGLTMDELRANGFAGYRERRRARGQPE